MSRKTIEERDALRSQVGRLQARLEAAEREALAWKMAGEVMEASRDALAAHVERLTPLVGHVLEQFERDARGEPMESDEDALAWADRAQSAVKDAPATSLARHDLLNQAVTLEELGDTWDWERCPNHKDLRHLAQQKRRQAEEIKP